MILSAIILGILPYLSSGVIDTTNVETLGLTMTDDTKTITIFSPDDETHHYANGVVMTAFKDELYCMWQSSKTDEDAPETCVMYSKSTDEGITWTKPEPLAAATDSSYCTSGGWISTKDTLTAFINVWPKGMQPTSGYTYYIYSTDCSRWSEPQPVRMADGQAMNGVMEQDPYAPRTHDCSRQREAVAGVGTKFVSAKGRYAHNGLP